MKRTLNKLTKVLFPSLLLSVFIRVIRGSKSLFKGFRDSEKSANKTHKLLLDQNRNHAVELLIRVLELHRG